MKIKSRSKLQHNSNWIIMIITVIALAIVFNLVIDITLNKFPLKMDLTPNRVLELTSETKEFLTTLDKEVNIIVFSTPGKDIPYVEEILDRYTKENNKITWQVIDPIRNPSYTAKYFTMGNALMINSVVVESGNRFKVLQAFEIFPADQEGNMGASIDAEGMITSAIAFVTSDKSLKIGFVAGHGETDIANSPLGVSFRKENIDYEKISLLASEVAEDIDYLIIAGARTDFMPEEIDRLDNYLYKGKGVQVLYAIDAPALPRLDSFMEEWGIVVNHDIIRESNTDNILGNNPNYIISQYMQSDITNSLRMNRLPTVLPMARSITTMWEDQFNVQLESILMSSSSSYAKKDPLSTVIAKEEGDISGPLQMAVMASRTLVEGNEPVAAGNMLVIGTANIYDETFLDYNTNFLLNAINSQTRGSHSIVIKPKSLVPSALVMNMSSIALSSIFVVFVIPLSIFIWGLIVWLKRRHL